MNLIATFQQMLTVEAQFLRQMPSGNPLGDALQDPYDQTTTVMGTLPQGCRNAL